MVKGNENFDYVNASYVRSWGLKNPSTSQLETLNDVAIVLSLSIEARRSENVFVQSYCALLVSANMACFFPTCRFDTSSPCTLVQH